MKCPILVQILFPGSVLSDKTDVFFFFFLTSIFEINFSLENVLLHYFTNIIICKNRHILLLYKLTISFYKNMIQIKFVLF